MSSITAQQAKLDLELVTKEKRLKIRKCNRRLNPGKIQREPTFQVVLDALALTPCYSAFLITADVPEVYMHSFWDSVYKHDTFYRFKIDKRKRFKLTLEIFKDIFKIFPRVQGQDFDALPTDEVVSFLRKLRHTGEINSLNDVVFDHMHQPRMWTTLNYFGKISFTKLTTKPTKSKYPRFTKVIIYYFLTQDKTLSWRNKIRMHTSRDDYLINTLRFVNAKEETQIYGAILPAFSTEAPIGKSKRVKRPAKKSTKTATIGVVIRETPEIPLTKKKEKVDVTRDDRNNEQVSSDEDNDQEKDSDDDKTQSDNELESDSKHDTDESKSGSESDHDKNKEDDDNEDETKIRDKVEDGDCSETLAEGTEKAPHLGPERPRVYSDLSPEEKDRMQLNSKFVNNMLPEWGRFVTTLKLNRRLRDSNYDQLYAYLKQHEAHANENKLMLNRFTKHIVDPLALMSNISHKNQATVQDDRVVVQNVQGRLNQGQGINPRGRGHIARNCTQPKRPQNSDYFKDKMLLMQAQENEVALDEEQLLFLAGGQDNAIDEDVDEQPIQDLALNVDNVFQADDCDAFDFDVDEAPMVQTMFMVNLSSIDPVYDEADSSYDSDILSEVHDHDHYQDVVCEHHEEHEIHDNVQPNHVVDSHADYMSDSNMISYDQYVKDNAVPCV
nr:hypothetical protein [Tanacetum cinerariifolium]